jgi:polyisoprenoid-binding protein YceI
MREMKMLRGLVLAAVALGLAGCGERELVSETAAPAPPEAAETGSSAWAAPVDVTGIPAGAYTLDPSHGSLVFRVEHMGFSNYTAQFKRFSVDLQLDPQDPAGAQLTAVIDPSSLDLTGAPDGFVEELLGPAWLDAGSFGEMTFRSTSVEMTAPDRAIIHGDFTMHGVTAPVDIEAVFNGGYAGQTVDPQARIGFSATGVLKRSVFGVSAGIPTTRNPLGVGDEVMFQIETEFLGPAWDGVTAQ